jgi:hypothetical protein
MHDVYNIERLHNAHDVTAAMLVFQFKRIVIIDSLVWNTNMAAMAFVELVPGE